MSQQPLIVSIPHRLGRQEAKRRLDSGISRLRPELAGLISTLDYSWDQDRLNFNVSAMWQTITGAIEVLDDAVRIEIHLPWMMTPARRHGRQAGTRARHRNARKAAGGRLESAGASEGWRIALCLSALRTDNAR